LRSTNAVKALSDLGFTALEAEVYVLLLAESPATGYRIAQLLGKPTANVYKALASLEQKGAVLVEEGPNRLARAIGPDELLAQAERGFRARRERAQRVLARMGAGAGDQKLYPLRGYDQVFERVRAMLERAEKLAILDLFPAPLALLRPNIEAAIARGVDVSLEVYEPTTLAGADIVLSWTPDQTLQRWPGEAIHLVVDAREWLIALLARGERRVLQAFWTASPFLAATQHTCLVSDFMQMKLRRLIEAGIPKDNIEAELEPYERFRLRNLPGFAGLCALAEPREGDPDRFGGTGSDQDETNQKEQSHETLHKTDRDASAGRSPRRSGGGRQRSRNPVRG
jgi:sugar-specific transcriptional regulator TrmB